MSDVHDKETRSYNMSRIASRNTKPELIVRRFLHSRGLRYSLRNKHLPGNPDIVFSRFRAAVFVNGCFWHGHKNCKYFVIPKTRTEWWTKKINGNIQRDKNAIRELHKLDWKTIVIWECALKSKKAEATLTNILNQLTTLKHRYAQA